MNEAPKISIILPVYNASIYLQKALDSLYSQTERNFEIIAINDGSTDDSPDILKRQTDTRLKIITNNKNQGLVFSLNLGLTLAEGLYIARMDADDICEPGRLSWEQKFLEEHPKYTAVFGLITMIDENDLSIGEWPEDQKTITPETIKKMLPNQNCLAHPTVMFRASTIKNYSYRKISLGAKYFAEDYYLWLQLIADGRIIGKISKTVLKYRIHQKSASNYCNNPDLKPKMISEKLAFSFKNISTKTIFLSDRLKKFRWSHLESRVLYHLTKEIFWRLASGIKKSIKKIINK